MTDPQHDGTHGPASQPPLELLGLAAGCRLAAWQHTAAASALAPTVAEALALQQLARRHGRALDALERALWLRGSGLAEAMEPFAPALAGFAQHTATRLWGEAVVTVAVLAGLAGDAARAVGENLEPDLAEVLLASAGPNEGDDPVGAMVGQVLVDQPELAGRMALFARRLLGEALSQAQRIAAAHPDLTALATGRDDGSDLAAVSELMAELGAAHTRRLAALGLAQ